MAGVKGRSGGARPNSGGARPGAGRPRKAPEPAKPGGEVEVLGETEDPVVFLTALMNDSLADMKLRADAAKALLPFKHAKKGEMAGGKKMEAADKAKKVAASSRFAAAAPPKLVAAGGKSV